MRFYHWYHKKGNDVYRIATDVALFRQDQFVGFMYINELYTRVDLENPTHLSDDMFIEEEPNDGYVNREIIQRLFRLNL